MWCKKRFGIILHLLDGMGWHRHGAWVVPTHFIGHLIYLYIYMHFWGVKLAVSLPCLANPPLSLGCWEQPCLDSHEYWPILVTRRAPLVRSWFIISS